MIDLSEFDLSRLIKLVDKRPISVLFLNQDETISLNDSYNGFEYLTIAKKHSAVQNVVKNSLCLVELEYPDKKECYLGVVSDKQNITTFDKRLTIKNLTHISYSSIQELKKGFEKKANQTTFDRRISNNASDYTLTPATSKEIIKTLLSDTYNYEALLNSYNLVIKHKKDRHINDLLIEDAKNLALKIFGVDTNKSERYVEKRHYEDNVVFHDLSNLVGFEKIESSITAKVQYRRDHEYLTIYNANKLPLEKMLGVDLIYINEIKRSIVMLQYKMLEKEGDTWKFRPDNQLNIEIERMVLPTNDDIEHDDYRLHSNPFFFKFVRRSGNNALKTPIIISLAHYLKLSKSNKVQGPRGGIRIGYEELKGCYLRSTDIIGLIRSGYVGTYLLETDALQPLINRVAYGDRAVLIAWQKRIVESQN